MCIESWTLIPSEMAAYDLRRILRRRRMSLLQDLEAFFSEHRRCGDLEPEVSDGEPGWVVIVCTCGAQIARHISGGESWQAKRASDALRRHREASGEGR